ncbi:hypothetical protein B9Z19DRAFT_1193947 [Tuber borchii]|uniref:Uncharacterized protein n=1 Tax=Tuber borchii TaxID=42251 RepID=A0A2T6ZQ14_TUBBO|nr:hypothetical protein B9Z19DRAFT_1193947 [Tuber borchii]
MGSSGVLVYTSSMSAWGEGKDPGFLLVHTPDAVGVKSSGVRSGPWGSSQVKSLGVKSSGVKASECRVFRVSDGRERGWGVWLGMSGKVVWCALLFTPHGRVFGGATSSS